MLFTVLLCQVQGLNSLIQDHAIIVQNKAYRRLVASEAYHTLKLLAPKLQQYLQQECTDWVIIKDFSLALRCITLSAVNILCLFAHFSPMNFLWIISF